MLQGKVWYFTFLSVALCWWNVPVHADVNDATLSFSMELMQKIVEHEDGNFIASPVSVHALLAMLQQGANGNTKHQLDQVIHADENVTREGYHNLTRSYQRSGMFSTIEFASKMFLRRGFDILSNFKESLATDFQADIESLDFDDTRSAVQHINSWVSESTHSHITDLFQPDDINTDSVLVLVNAIFFKSYWDHPFYNEAASKSFYLSANEEIQVPTMEQRNFYQAGISSEMGVKWLHLNFENINDYTFLCVLPTERHGLSSLRQLTRENWNTIFSYQDYKHVNVSIPKFKLKKETQLIPLLKSMGLQDMFENTADLSGIAAQRIKVSQLLQKATIAIDEHGVTASAATGGTAQLMSAFFIRDAEEMEFIADEPFLVFVINRSYGVPLFAGRVSNPLNE